MQIIQKKGKKSWYWIFLRRLIYVNIKYSASISENETLILYLKK